MSRISVCPGSIDAISGAVATVCEAIDAVVAASGQTPSAGSTADRRAFVAVRPPGHHCGEDTPSGFCFVNNVAVGAAHGASAPSICFPRDTNSIVAHLQHNINRVIILDIDLHHGMLDVLAEIMFAF